MSLSAIVLVLIVLCILGFCVIAFSADRGIVPKWLSRSWVWSGISTYVAGLVLFMGVWGIGLLGNPEPLFAFVNLLTSWLPQEEPALVTGLTIFGPMAAVPIIWGIMGIALLPFLCWKLVTGHERRRLRLA